MNLDNDYDNDGNNIVPCPICDNVYCPSKEGGKCPEEDEFAKEVLKQNHPSNLGGEVTRTLTEQIIELMGEEDEQGRYFKNSPNVDEVSSGIGFNQARTEMINKIPEILSLIEKKLMRGFDELESNDIDKSMEQWKNYKFIRNNIRDILK